MAAYLIWFAVPSAVVGFAIGRWWAVAAAVAVVGVFYAGLNAGWWGYGVGDMWERAMARAVIAGMLGSAVGVVGRRLLSKLQEDGPKAPERLRESHD